MNGNRYVTGQDMETYLQTRNVPDRASGTVIKLKSKSVASRFFSKVVNQKNQQVGQGGSTAASRPKLRQARADVFAGYHGDVHALWEKLADDKIIGESSGVPKSRVLELA